MTTRTAALSSVVHGDLTLPGRQVAAKTRTPPVPLQGQLDAWLYADPGDGGVWIGNPDNTPLSQQLDRDRRRRPDLAQVHAAGAGQYAKTSGTRNRPASTRSAPITSSPEPKTSDRRCSPGRPAGLGSYNPYNLSYADTLSRWGAVRARRRRQGDHDQGSVAHRPADNQGRAPRIPSLRRGDPAHPRTRNRDRSPGGGRTPTPSTVRSRSASSGPMER